MHWGVDSCSAVLSSSTSINHKNSCTFEGRIGNKRCCTSTCILAWLALFELNQTTTSIRQSLVIHSSHRINSICAVSSYVQPIWCVNNNSGTTLFKFRHYSLVHVALSFFQTAMHAILRICLVQKCCYPDSWDHFTRAKRIFLEFSCEVTACCGQYCVIVLCHFC
jgi:hypothetical protein